MQVAADVADGALVDGEIESLRAAHHGQPSAGLERKRVSDAQGLHVAGDDLDGGDVDPRVARLHLAEDLAAVLQEDADDLLALAGDVRVGGDEVFADEEAGAGLVAAADPD